MSTAEEPTPTQPGEISQFKCEFCNALFETEQELNRHEEICSGEANEPFV